MTRFLLISSVFSIIGKRLSIELRLLHEEHEVHFCQRPDPKACKLNDSSSLSLVGANLVHVSVQRPNFGEFIRAPDQQQAEEPELGPYQKYSKFDQYGKILYDTGCMVNMENTLSRFVQ